MILENKRNIDSAGKRLDVRDFLKRIVFSTCIMLKMRIQNQRYITRFNVDAARAINDEWMTVSTTNLE